MSGRSDIARERKPPRELLDVPIFLSLQSMYSHLERVEIGYTRNESYQ